MTAMFSFGWYEYRLAANNVLPRDEVVVITFVQICIDYFHGIAAHDILTSYKFVFLCIFKGSSIIKIRTRKINISSSVIKQRYFFVQMYLSCIKTDIVNISRKNTNAEHETFWSYKINELISYIGSV